MMMPSIFGENLFDDFMNDFTFPDIPGCRERSCMVNMQRI